MKHFKIDYFSGIWENHSLHEVADEYKLRGVLYSDFFEDGFITTIGGLTWHCYINNGIKIFVPTADLACVPLEIRNTPEFYDLTFPRIKIDFSGNGLDWYRSLLNKPVEDILRKPHPEFHPTRVDFAVDYVDEHPEVFKELRQHLISLAEQGFRRVCCAHLTSGCKYDLKLGDQSTIYLGGTSADMLLRIYDKKMEFTDKDGNWKYPIESLAYGFCNSWIRYEFQCRRDAAISVLYHPILGADGKPVYTKDGSLIPSDETLDVWAVANLRTMLERYAFRDQSKSIDHKAPIILSFWAVLLSDISEKVPIIQISHFVQFVKAFDRAVKNVEKYSNSISVYVAKYKISGLILLLQTALERQQTLRQHPNPDVSFGATLKHNAFLTILQSESSNLNDFPGLRYNSSGLLELNTDELLCSGGT